MEANVKNINVTSVEFVSNDHEVLVKGNISKGLMSYETELLITQTQLNMVLNQLKRQNAQFSIGDHLSSEVISEDETIYFANFESLASANIDLSQIDTMNDLRQIRA